MKNKNIILYLSLFVNVVCVIAIIILDVLLNKYVNNGDINNNNNENVSNIQEQQFYHCESNTYNDEGIDYYNYTINYDFIYLDRSLLSSSYYIKANFNNRDKYNDFSVTINGESSAGEKKDDANMIRYYHSSLAVLSDNLTLDEYISKTEEEYQITCNKVNYEDLLFFD